MRWWLAALGFASLAACGSPMEPNGPAKHVSDNGAVIAAAVAHPDRFAADRERDARDHPAEVLELLGIAPGMRVLDMNAATGYYTELLARTVGPTGHVIAHNHPGARVTLAPEDFAARYGDERLPSVEQIFVRHNDLDLPPETLDAVLMSMVYHDTYWSAPNVDWGPVDQHALLTALYRALRPGGVIGVIDHYAAAHTDPRESAVATHRIDRAVVERDFAAAGFRLAAESEVLRNPQDDRARSVFDEHVHGRTDRFVLVFGKPL